MCGRTSCTLRADDIPRACHLGNNHPTLQMDRYRPSYNLSPGSYLPVVRIAADDAPLVHCMKWGLIPSFTNKTDKPDHYRMFNARAETLHEKPSFCRILHKNRCLVVVDGFYEWWKGSSRKQPYYIHFKDGRPLVFAALFDTWRNIEGEIFQTFTIVTTCSSPTLQWLHDRMPVILSNKASTDAWLNGSSNCNLDMLLKPYEERDLVWYPVTPAMGKPSFDGPECIKEIPLKAEAKKISSFFTKKLAETQIENTKDGKLGSDCTNVDILSSMKGETTNGSKSPDDYAPMNSSNRKKEMEETENEVKCVLYATGGNNSEIVAPVMQQEECISSIKCGRTDVSDTSKLTLEKFDEIYAIPEKKRGKVMESSNKQPTLLCYFRKRQD